MEVLVLIYVYVLSIFICRYSYRMQYVWGHWEKESCNMSLIWFIPILNAIAGVFFLMVGYVAKERTYNYKLPNWFTNQDL